MQNKLYTHKYLFKVTMHSCDSKMRRKVWGVGADTPHWRKQIPWMSFEGTLAIDSKHLNQFLGHIFLMTVVTIVSH